jgi:hypothetical protein
MGSATAALAPRMLAARSAHNRQIATIALPLLPLSEDALNPFHCAADRGTHVGLFFTLYAKIDGVSLVPAWSRVGK